MCGRKADIAGSVQFHDKLVKHYRCPKCNILFEDLFLITHKEKKVLAL
jgi:hypothetical protein